LQVRTKVLDHFQDIALLMSSWRSQHSSSSSIAMAGSSCNGSGSSSAQHQAALDAAVSGLLHLTKAMYIITPRIVYALKDVNLLTGQLDMPPDSK
jgi:hypothetical protein